VPGSAEARAAVADVDERQRRRQPERESAAAALLRGAFTLQQELGSTLLPRPGGVVQHRHDLFTHIDAPSSALAPGDHSVVSASLLNSGSAIRRLNENQLVSHPGCGANEGRVAA